MDGYIRGLNKKRFVVILSGAKNLQHTLEILRCSTPQNDNVEDFVRGSNSTHSSLSSDKGILIVVTIKL